MNCFCGKEVSALSVEMEGSCCGRRGRKGCNEGRVSKRISRLEKSKIDRCRVPK